MYGATLGPQSLFKMGEKMKLKNYFGTRKKNRTGQTFKLE